MLAKMEIEKEPDKVLAEVRECVTEEAGVQRSRGAGEKEPGGFPRSAVPQ